MICFRATKLNKTKSNLRRTDTVPPLMTDRAQCMANNMTRHIHIQSAPTPVNKDATTSPLVQRLTLGFVNSFEPELTYASTSSLPRS